jgi:very-short-patch-repair endonuclease
MGDACDVEPPDRAVSTLAARQHGVVTRAQLLALGLSRHAIAHRLTAGRLHAVHRGVYAVGHRALSARGGSMAAVLACGPGAALSHRSAAVLWNLLPPADHPTHVSAPSRRRAPAGVRLHHSLTSELVHHDAVAVTTPARTILDLAATASWQDLARALEQARLLRLVTDAELRRKSHDRPGAPALRELLAHEPSLTRSEAERRFLRLLRHAGLQAPCTNTRVAGHEVDALWPQARLVVEVDGFAFHSSREAFERDRERDAALQAHGYRVLRVTWRQLAVRPEAVAARVGAALAAVP